MTKREKIYLIICLLLGGFITFLMFYGKPASKLFKDDLKLEAQKEEQKKLDERSFIEIKSIRSELDSIKSRLSKTEILINSLPKKLKKIDNDYDSKADVYRALPDDKQLKLFYEWADSLSRRYH